jgi:hypothetical protein
MELKDILAVLEQSSAYQAWRAGHAQAFLAHAFVMLDEPNKNIWQIGYFDEAANSMTTFVVSGRTIGVIPDQEVLKAKQRILPLDPRDVLLPVAEALALAQKAKLQHYPQEQAVKTFFIIQNLEEHGPVFNITVFTAAFKTINIKLSTKNGGVLHHSMQALAAFG